MELEVTKFYIKEILAVFLCFIKIKTHIFSFLFDFLKKFKEFFILACTIFNIVYAKCIEYML